MTAAPAPLTDDALADLGACGLAACTLLIYACVLSFGYVFDDHLVLPQLPDWTWRDRYLLTTLTFRASTDPAVQHAINLALHVINGGLFYWLLIRWHQRSAVALLATAIVLLHPLQIETVAYVSGGRPDLLIALGLLIALHGVARVPRFAWLGVPWANLGTGLICLGMAICVTAKPSGIFVLPLLYVLAGWQRPVLMRVAWLRYVVWLAVVGITTNYLTLRGVLDLHGWAYQSRVALQLAAVQRWLTLVLTLGWGVSQTADWNVAAWVPAAAVEVRVLCGLAAAACAWRLDDRFRLLIGWLMLTIGWRVLLPSSEWFGEGDGYVALYGVALCIAVFAHELVFDSE